MSGRQVGELAPLDGKTAVLPTCRTKHVPLCTRVFHLAQTRYVYSAVTSDMCAAVAHRHLQL